MRISKKNEVYLVIDEMTDSSRQELTEFFTFEVPGFKFMPQYRNRMWDGKIRLFSSVTGEIYVGLLEYIKGFCDRNQIDYILEEGVENERNIVREVVRNFIRSLKPKSQGKSLKVRDYQIDAVHHCIARNRALIVSPTASGKSLVIYSLVRYYHMMGLKTLILVPTTSLVEQMYTDFEDYGWSSGTYCQKVYQGHDRKVTKDIVISTWQSVYKMPTKYFEDFGCVIGDEAHLFKAKSLTGIMTKLHTCKYRFGLTGTLDGTQTHQLVLEGLFGPVEKVVTTKELIEKKTLADLKIKCIILKHENVRVRMEYAEELEYIVTHKGRQDFVINLLKHLKGNTLCLFQLVEKHGKPLHEAAEKTITDRNVYFVYGGTGTDTREEIRGLIENAKDSIVIASYGTFSTGINIRNIHNIVLASPSKSKIRVLQSIGRGLRQGDTKDSVIIFDIADDLTFRNQSNFTLNHFQERINIYNEEQFNYEISKVTLQ
jgi:superfamily II DNA or RNA helicase|tara:strand:+ start:15 stop:1469 length:1455 start_codon:yes stop_codon:yes gene_type:complete